MFCWLQLDVINYRTPYLLLIHCVFVITPLLISWTLPRHQIPTSRITHPLPVRPDSSLSNQTMELFSYAVLISDK